MMEICLHYRCICGPAAWLLLSGGLAFQVSSLRNKYVRRRLNIWHVCAWLCVLDGLEATFLFLKAGETCKFSSQCLREKRAPALCFKFSSLQGAITLLFKEAFMLCSLRSFHMMKHHFTTDNCNLKCLMVFFNRKRVIITCQAQAW